MTFAPECLSSGPIHSSNSTPSVNLRLRVATSVSNFGTEGLFSSQSGVITGQPPSELSTSLIGASSIISICAKMLLLSIIHIFLKHLAKK